MLNIALTFFQVKSNLVILSTISLLLQHWLATVFLLSGKFLSEEGRVLGRGMDMRSHKQSADQSAHAPHAIWGRSLEGQDYWGGRGLQGEQDPWRRFTSMVAVCSKRAGLPAPQPSARGTEYWGATAAIWGWSVATINGVQEPWWRRSWWRGGGRGARGGGDGGLNNLKSLAGSRWVYLPAINIGL